MRILSGVCVVIMVLFTLVQYNDPDGPFWAAIYGAAALLCGLAAFRPSVFAQTLWRGAMLLALVLGVFGMVWFWPKTPGFWHMEVWWETETAREGMGMMITLAALLVAWATSRRFSRLA